ncbi:hypothetical protein BDV93DRAFT_524035 [Ceratobasidium sp. AG-I]|nr:hypothetical protein BDV93DRAFT_524035 [Ceratobasidium sp. AG-I]
MLSLPPEICALIVAQVGTKDLAHLARTSHTMLARFVPYLWTNVRAESLLALLPGARFERITPYERFDSPCAGQVDIPVPLPTNYFDRFHFYARNVTSIFMSTYWDHDETNLSQHTLAWPSVTSYASLHNLFPNLTGLYIRLRDEHSPIPWDWVTLFIVPTLTEIEYHVPLGASLGHSRALGLMLSKCPDLGQMTLLGHDRDWPLDQIASSPVPQSLRSLYIWDGTMGISFLSWVGRMPQLEKLDLIPAWWGTTATTLPDADFPPQSFPALVSLILSGGDNNLLAHLFRTSIVTHLTKLSFDVEDSGDDDITTSELFTLLAAHSPGLQDLDCSGDFYVNNSDITSLHLLPLQSLRFLGSGATGAELSMAALSGLSPNLKVLLLNSYVSLETAMRLPIYLPRLERLEICIDPQAIPDAVDTSHLSGASLEKIRVIWLSHPFTLTIRSDHWKNPKRAKLEMCAKIFAMTWPYMKLNFYDPEILADPIPHVDFIEKRLVYYSELVLQHGRLD